MLNIISRSVYQRHPSGPKKLIDNLLKAFQQLGIPYVLNKHPYDATYTWIHDDPDAIEYLSKNIPNNSTKDLGTNDRHFLFGPNIYLRPEQIISKLGPIEKTILSQGKYIMPSEWVLNFWKKYGFNTTSSIWPVGVDTEYFKPESEERNNTVLVYTKGRSEKDINHVTSFLNEKNIPFIIFKYGSYTPKDFLEAGRKCKFGILIGSSESQGLATEELLSLNLPLAVFDIEYLNQYSYEDSRYIAGEQNKISRDEATSVPYFDGTCGAKATNPEDLKKIILDMYQSDNLYSQFKPREYIENNLSLKKQALDFLKLIDYPIVESSIVPRQIPLTNNSLNSEDKGEIARKMRNWKNRTWLKPFLMAKYIASEIKYRAKL